MLRGTTSLATDKRVQPKRRPFRFEKGVSLHQRKPLFESRKGSLRIEESLSFFTVHYPVNYSSPTCEIDWGFTSPISEEL